MVYDYSSGIRERLALLAALGPSLDSSDWGYHSSKDYWYYCGSTGERRTIPVTQEGSASLALIEKCWHLSRVEAMEHIGHPEKWAKVQS